jgi:hypothetical protein
VVQVIAASFFGVGAPEALLVAVVSLIVFGPKGLAEARPDINSPLDFRWPLCMCGCMQCSTSSMLMWAHGGWGCRQ